MTRSRLVLQLLLLTSALAACEGSGITDPGEDGYSDAELAYFAEIAFGAEYGGGGSILHRWGSDVGIRVHGSPTSADLATLTAVTDDINGIIEGVRLRFVQGGQNVDVYFVPQADFIAYEPNYVPGNVGFVWVTWGSSQRFTYARIMIAADIAQADRLHVIREELTQSLGLLRDSDRYPKSIFYGPPSRVTVYDPIDRAVIEMLYRREVSAGMSAPIALGVLRTLQRLRSPAAMLAGGSLSWGAMDSTQDSGRPGAAGAGISGPHR